MPTSSEPYGLYTCLGLERTATPQQIKKAYRTLAMRHHPDKGGDPEIFKTLTHAHSTLMDPTKRRQYDRSGGLECGEAPAAFDPSFFFTSGHPFHNPRRTSAPPTYTLRCTLEELYMGTTKTISISHDVLCHTCNGHGSCTRGVCSQCKGQGAIVSTHTLAPGYVQQTTRSCGACVGTGKVPGTPCTNCGGKGHTTLQSRRVLTIPERTRDGTTLTTLPRLGGVARMSSGQYQERPLVIKVAAQPHKVFRRFRDHLVMNLDISVLDMLCGFSTTVSMLDETLLRIHSPKLFPYVHGTVLKVRGRGFTSTGNLFVELKLVPLAATIQDMDHIQQLEAILGQKCTRDYNAVENSAVVDPRQFQADTSTTPNSSKSASECHVQ